MKFLIKFWQGDAHLTYEEGVFVMYNCYLCLGLNYANLVSFNTFLAFS